MRNLVVDRPSSMSQVHCTSLAVKGWPSCQRTPCRSRKVNSVPSSFHDQSVARSGTIDCNLFCGTCWSKTTRLLNTAIIGATVEIVTSSSVDMLAGLSRCATRNTPPGCCASAGPATARAVSPATPANRREFIPTRVILLCASRPTQGASVRTSHPNSAWLLVEPYVFEAGAIVNAVDHADQTVDVWPPAGDAGHVQDVRARVFFDQLLLDLPNQLPSLAGIGFPRLPVDQLVNRLVAISGVIAQRAALVIFVELRIGIVNLALGDIEPDLKILAHQTRIPLRCVHRFELAVDIDLPQLVDQDQGGVAPGGHIARCDGDGKAVVRAISDFLHGLPRFGAPPRNIGAVAGQRFQHLPRHAPQTLWRRLHRAADRALPLADDVDERLAVQGQRHRVPEIRVVEGRHPAVHDQVTAAINQVAVADHIRNLFFDVPELRERDTEVDVGLADDEAQEPRRGILDDRPFDALEIRSAGFPVIGVLGDTDDFVRLEFDKLERAGTDRMEAHVARRHVTGINGRPS